MYIRNFERAFPVNREDGTMENEESKKQSNIKIIVELLMKESPERVSELLVFIENYLSQ